MALNIQGEMEAAIAELSAAEPDSSPESTGTTETTPTEESSEAAASPIATQDDTEGAAPAAAITTDDKPKGPLPFERHKEILDRTRREYEEKLSRLSWAEKIQQPGLDAETLTERLRALELAEQNPIEFYERMGRVLREDPRFASRFQTQAPTAKPEAADEPMPEADLLFENGQQGYSASQMQKLLDWQAKRVERSVTSRYEPIEQQFKGAQRWNEALATQSQRLNEARTSWEGFAEYEKDIHEAMKADGRATLESAYRKVVIPKLKANEATMRQKLREELLAELNTKAQATTVQPGRAPVVTPKSAGSGPRSIRDLVAETAAELIA